MDFSAKDLSWPNSDYAGRNEPIEPIGGLVGLGNHIRFVFLIGVIWGKRTLNVHVVVRIR